MASRNKGGWSTLRSHIVKVGGGRNSCRADDAGASSPISLDIRSPSPSPPTTPRKWAGPISLDLRSLSPSPVTTPRRTEDGGECIMVGIRIRPLNGLESGQGSAAAFVAPDDHTVMELSSEGISTNTWSFDHVYGPEVGTDQIFESLIATKIVEKSLAGYNGTVFAYGQTSSGKTYTFMGERDHPGLIWLAVDSIFNRIRDTFDIEFLVRLSYIEIFKEEIRDLLNPSTTERLRVVEDRFGPTIKGLREEVVVSKDQVYDLIRAGERNRHYGATQMNELSSRSHVLFRLVIESRLIGPDEPTAALEQTPRTPRQSWTDTKAVRSSNLYLVDLAGSERTKKAGSSGERLMEGNAINKSLLALGTVISKLSDGIKGAHIPYRDSILTRLLSSTLGGNAKTAMLSTISPAEINREETNGTLRYASRAKKIKNRAEVNEITDGNSLLGNYRKEIEDLKKQLVEAQSAQVNEKLVELQTKREEDLEQLQDSQERLNQLQKLIIVSKVIEKAAKSDGDGELINKGVAKKLEKDLVDIARGRRRAGSVYREHMNVYDQFQAGRTGKRETSKAASAAGENRIAEEREDELLDESETPSIDGSALHKEISALQVQLKDLEAKYATSQEKIAEAKNEIDYLKKDSKQKLEEEKGKTEQSLQELALVKKENEKLKDSLAREQATVQSVEIELEDLKEEMEDEIDSLLHENKDLLRKIEKLNTDLEKSSQDASQSQAIVNNQLNHNQKLMEDMRSIEAKSHRLEEEVTEVTRRKEELEAEVKKLESALETVQQEKRNQEERWSMKEKEILELKEKLDRAKIEHEKELSGRIDRAVDEKTESLDAHVKRLLQENETMKHQLTKMTGEVMDAKESEKELKRLRDEMAGLQEEVDKATRRSREAEKLISKEKLEVEDARFRQRQLEGELTSSRQKIETLSQKKEALREQMHREVGVLKSRQEALDSAQEKAQAALSSKRALENQLEELTTSYVKALNDKRLTEEENIDLKGELAAARENNRSLQEEAFENQDGLSNARRNEAVHAEVEALRRQLGAMRAAMLEVGSPMNGDIMMVGNGGGNEIRRLQLENQRQQKIFESIIKNLRNELASEGERRAKLQDRVKELQPAAETAQRLSEEMDSLTREARKAEEGLQFATLAASESQRGNLMLQQERDAAERDMVRLRESSQNNDQEINYLRGVLEKERQRAQLLNEECSHHESKAAEHLAAANRAETELELLKSEVKRKELELFTTSHSTGMSNDKLFKLQQDYLSLLDEHALLQAQCVELKATIDRLSKECREHAEVREIVEREVMTQQALNRENEHLASSLRYALSEREEEYQAMQRHCSSLQETFKEIKVRGVQEADAEVDRQLEDLREELSHVMSEWKKTEKARQRKEGDMAKVKSLLQAQVEKNALLKTQIALLEDQLGVVHEEVSIYRQLGVYDTTLDHALESIRVKKKHTRVCY